MTLDLRRLGILFGVLDVKNESGMFLSWSTRAFGLEKLIQSACERPQKRIHYILDLGQVVYLLRPIADLDVCLTVFLPNASRRILQIWNKYELIRFGLLRVKRQGCYDPSGLTLSPQVDSSGIPWGDFKCFSPRWLFCGISAHAYICEGSIWT